MKVLTIETNEAVVRPSEENRDWIVEAVRGFNDLMQQAGLRLRLEAGVSEVYGLRKGAKKWSGFGEMVDVEELKLR